MAKSDIGAPGLSAPSTSPIKYDVFLSFSGIDIRKTFAGHLYSALRRKGIKTFKDDTDLGRGQPIPEQLFRAIEQSQIAIVVLSRNYFSSSWLLDELQKIIELKDIQGLTIFPVFYDIHPSDVRCQRGSIAEAFEIHEARFSDDKVRRWKEALTTIANLSGWDIRSRDEAEIVEVIAQAVWDRSYKSLLPYFDHLVGDIPSKVNDILLLSEIGLDDIRFVGICGMGGVGKTTLVQVVYDAVRSRFDASCFLGKIRELSERYGFVYLQRMLLSNLGLVQSIDDPFDESVVRHFLCNKKVLIILDDVSDRIQLENLVGSEQRFGPGSRIIITTRDKSLLTVYNQCGIYEVGTLDPGESLNLFCQRAFKKNGPEEDYLDLSKEVIEYACGLPLALVVLGSFLYQKEQSEWRDTLNKCRKSLPKDVFISLRISYDELEEECKIIFLDIACFFNGRTKFEVTNILETCGVHPIIGIRVLIEKSLLSSTQSNSNSNSRHNAEGQDLHDRLQKMRSDIFLPTFMFHNLLPEASQESLHMHNILQKMGREIVYRESPGDAGGRSRLWDLEDIDRVLKGNNGTGNIQSIVLDLRHPFIANWHPDCFLKMRNLRLLDLSRVQLAHNLNSLPSALKFLRWDCYALEFLPAIDQLYELESLQLRSSNITRLWDGILFLSKLRTIDLSNSDDLKETPNFGGTPNLEKLAFNYCKNLVRVHESVGQLKKLVVLSLRYCINLETLPTCLDMNNLEVFILGECSKLEKLPGFSKNMGRLYFLDVRNTKITEIPLSIINLVDLKYLDLRGCSKLKSIPDLPPNSIIHANKDPFLAFTLDLQHLIESRVSKHPSVAEDPIHLVFDSKETEEILPWFDQQELCHSKDSSGEVVTITADIPSDLANYEGECWGIAVCIIFECLSREAWGGFTIDWMFQDYDHTNDKKGSDRSHPTHAGSQVDLAAKTIHSTLTVDDIPQAETEHRVYTGFFPIDEKKCRQHPSGVGIQVDLTLRFVDLEIIQIVDCGWRLVSKKDLNTSSAQIRHEAEIAEDTANFLWNKLGGEMPSNFEHFVGDIQSKIDSIISLLKMRLDDKCFIGISGTSGIGKTTLARLVYDAIQSKFDASCFLDNVREDSERVGIVSLQKKLLSELGLGEWDLDDDFQGAKIIRNFLCCKRVLIILDDVSQRSQLENLAGNKEWFGAGSKIVITTKDITLLTLYEQYEQYEVGRLHPDESLKLLCREAFKKDEPEQDYLDLSKEVIEYACGLPLVLKVLGSFLCKKDQYEWKNASERLRQYLPIDIFSQLRISYDGLEDEEYKRIFLDIACFFNREAKFKVANMLELCGLHSTSGIGVLIEKSMLNFTHSNSKLRQNTKEDQDMLDRIQKMRRDIFLPTHLYDWLLQEASKEYLYMHDLLQEMGRNIVSQESPIAGTRSRLWCQEDINDVLKEDKGTGNVQSIVLYIQQSFEADWHPDCFSNMQNLKLLDLSKVHLSSNLNSLPTALKILRWDYYTLESLPQVDQLHELESLQLHNSKIRKLWEGAPVLNKLRIIDLSDSDCLETPDFSGTPNLEELVLNSCRKLVQVHESVGKLKKLVMLRLEYCRNLTTLPAYLEMDNLAEFILSGCLKLEKLPEFGRNMGSLYFLDVRGTDITEIPLSIVHLTNLKYLDLTFCNRLKLIPKLPPNSIISASNCHLLEPTSALRHLYASCTPKLPRVLQGPIHLFYDFQLWTRIPTWFERWEYCWGKDTSSEIVTITADIPSDVADYERQCWGIAVCIVFQFLSQAWLGFSIDWKFKDSCLPNKTKIHGTPAYYMHDCRVYIGFYPFEAKDCRQHPTGEGTQLDLTLGFPATNIINDLHDLEIMGCGWRLACKNDFDAWRESRVPSPPRLGFLNRDTGESRNNSITEGKGKRKYQEFED